MYSDTPKPQTEPEEIVGTLLSSGEPVLYTATGSNWPIQGEVVHWHVGDEAGSVEARALVRLSDKTYVLARLDELLHRPES